jgi:hypothetical protein
MIFVGERWPRRAAAGLLVAAITGTLAFSMAGDPGVSVFEARRAVSGGLLVPTEVTSDWLAEGAAIISRAREYSTRLCGGTLRTYAASGVQSAGMLHVQSSVSAVKKTQYTGIRNIIILKLRI